MILANLETVCVLVNEDTVEPLSKLWGVKESSLRRMCKEMDDGKTVERWQSRLMKIEKDNKVSIDEKAVDAVRRSIRDNDSHILKSLLDGLDRMNGRVPDTNNADEAKRIANEIYVKEHGINTDGFEKLKEGKKEEKKDDR